MTSTKDEPVVVVLQLTGGNDYLNTVVPYNDPLYYDYRPNLGFPEDQILKILGGNLLRVIEEALP